MTKANKSYGIFVFPLVPFGTAKIIIEGQAVNCGSNYEKPGLFRAISGNST